MNTLIVVAVLLPGCIESTARETAVRARAADDFGCSDQDVQVIPSGGGQYVAKGCGHRAWYICTPPKNPFAENYACSPMPPPGFVPPRVRSGSTHWRDRDARHAEPISRPAVAAVRACRHRRVAHTPG